MPQCRCDRRAGGCASGQHDDRVLAHGRQTARASEQQGTDAPFAAPTSHARTKAHTQAHTRTHAHTHTTGERERQCAPWQEREYRKARLGTLMSTPLWPSLHSYSCLPAAQSHTVHVVPQRPACRGCQSYGQGRSAWRSRRSEGIGGRINQSIVAQQCLGLSRS